MAYTHLTMKELGWIETYFEIELPVQKIAQKIERSRQTVYNVVNYLKSGGSIQEYFDRYKANKKKCGAKKKELLPHQVTYVKDKIKAGWTPDVIIGRNEMDLGCSVKTLYRRFKDSPVFDVSTLPMEGKRKPNGHAEKRGKQAFKRGIEDRSQDYPNFEKEFGHLEGDTIIGKDHKSAVITLAERTSKLIISLKPDGRRARDIEQRLTEWLTPLPVHLFKSITFDCGKEFSNWKSLSNQHDISIFFADPGCPSQRGLNEHSNGLLRRDGLPK